MTDTPLPTQTFTWPRLGMRPLVMTGLGLVMLLVFLASLALGSVEIPLSQIITILFGGEAQKASWETIVWQFRVPKGLTAVLAGSALAISGLQMQTLFRNPLAGPFVLGINSGASLGVAIVVLAAGFLSATLPGSSLISGLSLLGDFSLVVASSLGSATVLFMVMSVARRVHTMTLLILGLMFGYATGALVSLLLYFSVAERVQAYVSWTFGSFGGVTWSQLRVLAPAILLGLFISWTATKSLNALLLGENYASTMGIAVKRARFWILVSASILAGSITAFCGPIGFIGIAVPHLCRSLFRTSDHRTLVPATILMGGLVALIADIVAQMPGSQTILPLNAVTALIGAPIVVWVIMSRRNLRQSFAG